jgi:hypothetical protein
MTAHYPTGIDQLYGTAEGKDVSLSFRKSWTTAVTGVIAGALVDVTNGHPNVYGPFHTTFSGSVGDKSVTLAIKYPSPVVTGFSGSFGGQAISGTSVYSYSYSHDLPSMPLNALMLSVRGKFAGQPFLLDVRLSQRSLKKTHWVYDFTIAGTVGSRGGVDLVLSFNFLPLQYYGGPIEIRGQISAGMDVVDVLLLGFAFLDNGVSEGSL